MEQYKGIQAKWEFSNKEKAFIDYCIKNNYEIIECKQYVSKTKWKFKINNSIVDTWETLEDESKFDEKQVDNYVKIKIELEDMRNKMN